MAADGAAPPRPAARRRHGGRSPRPPPGGGSTPRRIAVLSALHEELHALLALLEAPRTVRLAQRDFHLGDLHGRPVLLALSGIGKVAAATTASVALHAFDPAALVFTGVAGGLGTTVAVGDVVVADALLQHDMDASPLFPRYEVPLTGRARFAVDAALADGLAAAASQVLAQALPGGLDLAAPPRLHRGLVVSGDRFVATAAESADLRRRLPDALAVEMEGGAVAQVCADFERPFAVLRTISDRADDSAHVDFGRFVERVASVYTRAIVGAWLASTAPAGRCPPTPPTDGARAG